MQALSRQLLEERAAAAHKLRAYSTVAAHLHFGVLQSAIDVAADGLAAVGQLRGHKAEHAMLFTLAAAGQLAVQAAEVDKWTQGAGRRRWGPELELMQRAARTATERDRDAWPPVLYEHTAGGGAQVTHGWPLALNGTAGVAGQFALAVGRRLQIALGRGR